MTYMIAKSRELPSRLERLIWSQPLEGLFITAAATVVLANVMNLDEHRHDGRAPGSSSSSRL